MSEYANYDDYNDPDEENGYDAIYGTKKLTFGKIVKKILVYSLRIFAIVFFSLLFWRFISTGETKFSKSFLWNESAITAYNQNSNDFLVYHYKREDNFSNNGRFSAINIYFVPAIGQFQITVRYNNSTLKKLAEDYGLDKVPENEVFVYTLSDNLGNIYTEYTYAEDSKPLYNYRKVIFDNVDMHATKTLKNDDGTTSEKKFEQLYINIYYRDDVVFSKPYGTIPVYDTKFYHEPFDIGKYMFTDNTPSEKLKERTQYTVK